MTPTITSLVMAVLMLTAHVSVPDAKASDDHRRHPNYNDPRWDDHRWYRRYGYHRPGYHYPRWSHLPESAVRIVIQGDHYYLSQGLYFRPDRGGYMVVRPPVGQVIEQLPAGYHTIDVDGGTYYEFGGVWYAWNQAARNYRIIDDPRFVRPAPERVISELPAAAEPVTIEGVDYMRYQGRHYLPSWQQGAPVYIEVRP
ncbi:DUF6515 family protein [Motiliproteus sediminis]|uniref:DUF6515 family protein n=1 Tax=Motiliproteus sediminis TaxID=1468178 RepID=UPI001AEF97C1|nr:DUF6515 family protein [Motiliproteus sediminis]